MFRVDTRFIGEGLWSRGALPSTAQGAWGQARAANESKFADEVRVTPSQHETRVVDFKV